MPKKHTKAPCPLLYNRVQDLPTHYNTRYHHHLIRRYEETLL